MLKNLLILLASIALSGIIISPFFWLKFLKEKSVAKWLLASSVGTLVFLYLYINFVYDFISNLTAKINADLYYFFYNVIDYVIYIVIFLIVISPFIFTKISQNKFVVKNFLISLFCSIAIFVSIFLYWALVLLPKAFSQLHDHF